MAEYPWFPSINSRGGLQNETHQSHNSTLFSLLEFRVILQRLGLEVLRRGAGLSAFFSNLYLFESEGELGGASWPSVLFSSLYLDGCLSIIVSIHDLLCALVSSLVLVSIHDTIVLVL